MTGQPQSANGSGSVSPRRLAALTAGLLLIDDARMYGLIDSGPDVDRARCAQVLGRLKRDGVVSEQDEISSAALSIMAELGVLRR